MCLRRRAQLLRNSLEELIELSSLGQTEFNTVIKVKYYGHMARVINTAAIYEEKRHTHTHTHTQTKQKDTQHTHTHTHK